MSKLRGKLEDALPDRRFIHTHPGFGYRFQPQPSPDGAGASTQLVGEPPSVDEPPSSDGAVQPEERGRAGSHANLSSA